jgi:hypothetical protein
VPSKSWAHARWVDVSPDILPDSQWPAIHSERQGCLGAERRRRSRMNFELEN